MDMDEKENSLYSGNTEEQNMENGEKVSSGDLFTVLNEEKENTDNKQKSPKFGTFCFICIIL